MIAYRVRLASTRDAATYAEWVGKNTWERFAVAPHHMAVRIEEEKGDLSVLYLYTYIAPEGGEPEQALITDLCRMADGWMAPFLTTIPESQQLEVQGTLREALLLSWSSAFLAHDHVPRGRAH